MAPGLFVGRQREIETLQAALQEALAGRGQIVMLVGEPGIGKTRTVQELASFAGQRGVQVVWGRCFENPGAPPYWPWVQGIRSYLQGRETAVRYAQMGGGAADIAEMVPEVGEQLSDLPLYPSPADPEQARFRLFDSITTF